MFILHSIALLGSAFFTKKIVSKEPCQKKPLSSWVFSGKIPRQSTFSKQNPTSYGFVLRIHMDRKSSLSSDINGHLMRDYQIYQSAAKAKNRFNCFRSCSAIDRSRRQLNSKFYDGSVMINRLFIEKPKWKKELLKVLLRDYWNYEGQTSEAVVSQTEEEERNRRANYNTIKEKLWYIFSKKKENIAAARQIVRESRIRLLSQ